MKITAFLIFIALLQVHAYSFGQKITLNQKNVSLDKVLTQIRKQTNYNFVYTNDVIRKAKNVSIDVHDVNIDDVLGICFKNQPLSYSIIDNVVVIKEKSAPPQAVAVFQKIHGRVIDDKGVPLPGAGITIKGTGKGTTANENGEFDIDAQKGDVLIISFVSLETKEITIGDNTNLQVTLAESVNKLNQVVVTALGIKREQRALGYSTTQIGGDKFTESRETNLGNALTGQVAGVSVGGVATGPSGSNRVVIRGNASLTGNNQPLYIIDGVPLDNTQLGFASTYGGPDFGDGLSTINPDDIESINVLKGVAASALYGYRGGNGAIVITTKSGSTGKGIGIEFNNNFTANNVVDLRNNLQYVYGQGYNGVKPTTADQASSGSFGSWGAKMDGSDFVDFLGVHRQYSPAKGNYANFFKTGITNQSSFALTGNNDKGHFRLGISNLYLSEVVPNSTMKQQGLNYNSEYHIAPKLQVNLNANYVFEQVKNRPSFSDSPGNAIASVDYLASSVDVRWLKQATDANGNEQLPNRDDPYTNNPYFVTQYFQNKTARNRLTGALSLKYNILEWLFLQGGVTRDGYVIDHTEITPTGTAFSPDGFIYHSDINFHEVNSNFLLDANRTDGKFKLHANFGGNSQDDINSGSSVLGVGFKVPYFYSIANTPNSVYRPIYSHYRVNSLYGSFDAGYHGYLFLTVTGRNDWFSTLSAQSNHYLYPSVSASFVFSDAFRLPSWISFGKVRASYANSSNGTSPYQNRLNYVIEPYSFANQGGLQPIADGSQTQIPNKFLKPIQISEKEAGVNVQFLENRVGIDLAVYNKSTTNDILPVGVSPTTGYSSNIVNIGKLRNKGVELLLTGSPVRSGSFTWNSSFNIAINNNKVLALTPPENSPVAVVGNGDNQPRWDSNVAIEHVVGLPYAQIVGYAYKRNNTGQIIYDADGYPERSVDPVPLGSAMYKTTGGFSNDFHYKNFTLSCLFDFKFGAKIYSGTNLLYYSNGQSDKTLSGREGGYVGPGVTEDGQPNTKAVTAQDYFYQISQGDYQVAEEFVYDASFIKLRSASLGFSLPQSWLKQGFIKKLSLSVVGRNLATLMKHTPNIDPESSLNNTNAQGLELAGFPYVRSIGFNLNAKF